MRRVCLLGTSPESKGGIGTVVRGYVEDIRPNGYAFNQIVTHEDCDGLSKISIACSALTRCLESIKKRDVDLFHIHSAFGASFYRSIPFIELISRSGVPVINHIHADDWAAFYGNASPRKQKLIKEIYSKCDKIVALSDEWADTLSSVVPAGKISVLENFTPVFDPKWMPNPGTRTVVFMSRLEKIKGCEILVEICERVTRRLPDITFLICGEGSLQARIVDEISERGLDRNVKMLGWLSGEQRIEVLKQGSAFFLPSYGEGMPMCILEAMGVGLPVVATKVGGVPRIVKHGVNGYLCEPGDIDGLADAVVQVFLDEATYTRMSRESKHLAERRSIPHYADDLRAIYDEVLEGGHVDGARG